MAQFKIHMSDGNLYTIEADTEEQAGQLAMSHASGGRNTPTESPGFARRALNLGVRTAATVGGGLLDTVVNPGLDIAQRVGNLTGLRDPRSELYQLNTPESVIHATGTELTPDAGYAEQALDVVAPFLVPTGMKHKLEHGAETLMQRGLRGARWFGGNAVDAGANWAAQQAVQAAGGGPMAQALVGTAAAGVRPGLGTLPERMGKYYARPDAPEVYRATTSKEGPGVTPTFGQMANQRGQQLEKSFERTPFIGSGIARARQRVEDAIGSAWSRGTGEVAGATHTGPIAEGDIGEALRNRMESQHGRISDAASKAQANIENAIMAANPHVDITDLRKRITDLMNDPHTGAASAKDIAARLGVLEEDVERLNPGVRQTITQATRANLATQKANLGKLGAAQAKHQAKAAAAATGGVTLKGKALTTHLEKLIQSKNMDERKAAIAWNNKIRGPKPKGTRTGQASITFMPGDPGYGYLKAPKAPTFKPPKQAPLRAVPPEPKTAAYGAVKDLGTGLTEAIEGARPLKGKVLGDIKAAVKETKYRAADASGVGRKARKADVQYAKSRPIRKYLQKRIGQPVKTAVGNVDFIGGKGNPVIAGELRKAMEKGDARSLGETVSHLGAQSTLGGVGGHLQNLGYTGRGEFSSKKLADSASRFSQPTKDLVQKHRPAAKQTLENTLTSAKALHLPPAAGNLTASMTNAGLIAALTHAATTGGMTGKIAAAAVAMMAHGMSSDRVIQVMAGQRGVGEGVLRQILSRLPASYGQAELNR